MLITLERGRLLSQFIVAWILCSVDAVEEVDAFDEVDAPHVQRDFASVETLRSKKDVGSLSTEFEHILPVQVNFGSLASTIDRRISGIEGNVNDLGKHLWIVEERLQKEASKLKQKLESSEESKAKMEEEVCRLKKQQESMTQSKAKMEEEVSRLKKQLKEIQESMKEEISQLREELKSAGAQKLHTTAESIKTTAETSYNSENRTLVIVGPAQNSWEDARAQCKRRGGDLATHLTEKEMNDAFSKADDDVYLLWVGGRMNPRAMQLDFWSRFEWLNGDRISSDNKLWDSRFQDYGPSYKCMYIHNRSTRIDGTEGPMYGAWKCVTGQVPMQSLCEIE